MSENYDPPEHARVWFRHILDGTIGYLVKRGGRDMIRLPSDGEEIMRAYTSRDWVATRTDIPKMSRAQLAMVAFAADRELCKFVGKYAESRGEWVNLTDSDRIQWMHRGPSEPPIRAALYEGIMGVLRKHSNETD